ncbi:hypothetical protein C8F04DRAFT_1260773 [Mycena alexandri]|uniref:Uncharacterized protein n=1 Tax=Mycena alexandri TaxID=1745969 RepID=A0AAD6STP6_9AGAR|nr:hypothetical protein C8F04DRAFT_1260773 [Mycena alexandri]
MTVRPGPFIRLCSHGPLSLRSNHYRGINTELTRANLRRRSNCSLLTTSVLPCCQFLASEEFPAEDMSNARKDDGNDIGDPPPLSSVADRAPGQIHPGPAVVHLAKALEGLRAMQERDHIQRVLDRTRASAEVAALEQDRLRKEAEARVAARYKEYLSRECPSSVAWSAEEAARKRAWDVARSQGIGMASAPSAVVRRKKLRLFSPTPDENDHPSQETIAANHLEKGERYANIDLMLFS